LGDWAGVVDALSVSPFVRPVLGLVV
jgi:hypothetical protein